METFSALLDICAGNSPVNEFRAQRPVTRSFELFFNLRLNKRLSKQSWDWWFETPSRSLWHHCNERKEHSKQKWQHTKNVTNWSLEDLGLILKIQFSILFNDWYLQYDNVLGWMSRDLTDDMLTLVRAMAWFRQATSRYLNQYWPRAVSPYGVTRPQCVKIQIESHP